MRAALFICRACCINQLALLRGTARACLAAPPRCAAPGASRRHPARVSRGGKGRARGTAAQRRLPVAFQETGTSSLSAAGCCDGGGAAHAA